MAPRLQLRRRRGETGSALIFALAMILALLVAGVMLVELTGGDRVDAGKMGLKDRGMACAETGLQYGRQFFGSRYETTHGWNDFLATPVTGHLGYRYDPANGDARPDLTNVPLELKGASNNATLDPGADVDGDGQPDFWVSIRDDDDERPLGIPDNPQRDNNETVILRAECTNPKFALTQGGQQVNVVLEAVLTHVQGSSGYGITGRATNASDLVGGR